MFKNLLHFSYKRNWKEAIGFYLAFVFLTIFSFFIIGMLQGTIGLTNENFLMTKIGRILEIVFASVIFILLLKNKKLFANFEYIILFLLNIGLTIFGGVFLGLIIPAITTTKEINNKRSL